ncbi:MAG: F-box protein [Verrucomicrobia bacterium]|nr:F-box protein [Verrucomicrobiota bacterium]
MLQYIFSFLPFSDLFRSAQVCKAWRANACAVGLRRFTVITPSVWEYNFNLQERGLSFEGFLAPQDGVLLLAAANLKSCVDEDQGVSIVAIPKGLSLVRLLAIAEKAKVPIERIVNEIISAIGNVTTERAYMIVVSNSVLKESRNKTIEARDTLVQGMGYEVPSTVELLAVIIFHYIMYSKRLLNHELCTWSQTSDSTDQQRFSVGDFGVSGFCIDYVNATPYIGEGVAGVQRFFPS